MTEPQPGDVLDGKFVVERILGRGAMGVVVAARHLRLDELSAIKLLLPETLTMPDAALRFEKEARAAAKLRSEHVARVSDVGVLDSGAPYMVMEYLEGRDLGALLEERGPFPLAEAADYLLQTCEGLTEAHGLGIVHRDLKPSNLFLARRADGSACVKILDFGVSKLTGTKGTAAQGSLTSTAFVMGSPLYMSPEQLVSARDVDERTDIWALGVSLFQLLTNAFPFCGETIPQLCVAVMQQPPILLRSLRPDLPPAVERLILDCLTKPREERIGSVAEFARRLADFAPASGRLSAERIARIAGAAGLSGSASASMLRGLPVSDSSPGEGTVTEFSRSQLGRASGKRWLLRAAALGGVCAAAAGLVVAFQQKPPALEPPRTATMAGQRSAAIPVALEPDVKPLKPAIADAPAAMIASAPPKAAPPVSSRATTLPRRQPPRPAASAPKKSGTTGFGGRL